MPILLCRYILMDLIKTMITTTVILVTIIAFGAAIKPLANDQILSAGQTLKYVFLAAIPMLQFALPFAAGFAATMVFYRLVQDNEIVAIRASGISHRQILMPVAALGLVLTLIMGVLTLDVIPRFWELMQRTITADVTRLFEASIRSGRPFVTDNMEIYADRIYVDRRDYDDAEVRRLHLERVAAVEVGDNGRVVTDVTAAKAYVDISRYEDETFISLLLEDPISYNRETGELIAATEVTPSAPIRIDTVFDDDPNFMSHNELKALRQDPCLLPKIDRLRQALARQLQHDQVLAAIDDQLKRVGSVELEGASGEGRSYIVRAAGVVDGAFVSVGGSRIGVQQLADGQPRRLIEADEVLITSSIDSILTAEQEQSTLGLIMRNLTIRDASGGPPNERGEVEAPDLRFGVTGDDDLMNRSAADLLQMVTQGERKSQSVRRAASQYREKRNKLLREIDSRLQRRYALSCTAILLLLLGTTLAMKMRDSLPLSVYVWAFLPSVLDLILISGGGQMMRDGQALGIVVLWSGNIGLLMLLLHTYWRVARN